MKYSNHALQKILNTSFLCEFNMECYVSFTFALFCSDGRKKRSASKNKRAESKK